VDDEARPVELPRELAEFLSQNSEEMPLVDLVVFDESHYMRNTETTTWRVGNLLREVSSYQYRDDLYAR
jgi:hypothetical protein